MTVSNLKFKMTEITPEMARKFLNHNHSNRNLRQRAVDEYKRAMDKGFWRITGDGISLDAEGKLLDGQHRLQAIIEHGKPVIMAVIRGVEAGAQQYMDSGKTRRISDNLKMFDGEKNSNLLVTISKAITLFDTGIFDSLLIDEVRKLLKINRAQFDWLPTVMNKDLPRSGFFYAPFLWLHKNGYEDEVSMFLDEMTTLEGLTRGSPVIALTKALERNSGKGGVQTSSLNTMMMTFNAIKAYVEDSKLQARSLLPSSKGFDYFNAKIKTFPKRRKKDACAWTRGCTFKKGAKGGGSRDGKNLYDYCWLHEHVRSKTSKKKADV